MVNRLKMKELELAQHDLTNSRESHIEHIRLTSSSLDEDSIHKHPVTPLHAYLECEKLDGKKRSIIDEITDYKTFSGTVEGMLIDVLR